MMMLLIIIICLLIDNRSLCRENIIIVMKNSSNQNYLAAAANPHRDKGLAKAPTIFKEQSFSFNQAGSVKGGAAQGQHVKGILTTAKKEKKMEVDVMKILLDIEDALNQESSVVLRPNGGAGQGARQNHTQSDNYRNYSINHPRANTKGDQVRTNHKTNSSKMQVNQHNSANNNQNITGNNNQHFTHQSNKTASKFIKRRGEFGDQTISSERSSSGESDNDDSEELGGRRNGQDYSSSTSEMSDSSDNGKRGSKYTKKEDDKDDSSLQSSSNARESETGNGRDEVKSIYSLMVNMAKSEGRHAEELKNKAEQDSSQQQANVNTTYGQVLSPLLREHRVLGARDEFSIGTTRKVQQVIRHKDTDKRIQEFRHKDIAKAIGLGAEDMNHHHPASNPPASMRIVETQIEPVVDHKIKAGELALMGNGSEVEGGGGGLLNFNGNDLEEGFTRKINYEIKKLNNEPRQSEFVDNKQLEDMLGFLPKKTLDGKKRSRIMSQQIEDEEQVNKRRASRMYAKQKTSRLEQHDEIQEEEDESRQDLLNKKGGNNNQRNQGEGVNKRRDNEDYDRAKMTIDSGKYKSKGLKGYDHSPKWQKKRRNSDHSGSISRRNSMSKSDNSQVERSKTSNRRVKDAVREQIRQNKEMLGELGSKRKRSQKIRDLVEQHFAKQEQLKLKKKSSITLKREELKAKIANVKIPPKNMKGRSPSKQSLERADSKKGSVKQHHNSNEKIHGGGGGKHVSNLIIASMSSNITPTFHPSNLNSNSPIPIGSLTTSGFIDTNSLKYKQTMTIVNNTLSKNSKKGDDNQQSLNNFDEHEHPLVQYQARDNESQQQHDSNKQLKIDRFQLNKNPNAADQVNNINPMVNPHLQEDGTKVSPNHPEHFLDRLQKGSSKDMMIDQPASNNEVNHKSGEHLDNSNNNNNENSKDLNENNDGTIIGDKIEVFEADFTDKEQIVPQISLGREYQIKEPGAPDYGEQKIQLRPRSIPSKQKSLRYSMESSKFRPNYQQQQQHTRTQQHSPEVKAPANVNSPRSDRELRKSKEVKTSRGMSRGGKHQSSKSKFMPPVLKPTQNPKQDQQKTQVQSSFEEDSAAGALREQPETAPPIDQVTPQAPQVTDVARPPLLQAESATPMVETLQIEQTQSAQAQNAEVIPISSQPPPPIDEVAKQVQPLLPNPVLSPPSSQVKVLLLPSSSSEKSKQADATQIDSRAQPKLQKLAHPQPASQQVLPPQQPVHGIKQRYMRNESDYLSYSSCNDDVDGDGLVSPKKNRVRKRSYQFSGPIQPLELRSEAQRAFNQVKQSAANVQIRSKSKSKSRSRSKSGKTRPEEQGEGSQKTRKLLKHANGSLPKIKIKRPFDDGSSRRRSSQLKSRTRVNSPEQQQQQYRSNAYHSPSAASSTTKRLPDIFSTTYNTTQLVGNLASLNQTAISSKMPISHHPGYQIKLHSLKAQGKSGKATKLNYQMLNQSLQLTQDFSSRQMFKNECFAMDLMGKVRTREGLGVRSGVGHSGVKPGTGSGIRTAFNSILPNSYKIGKLQ